jgi:hypothetical protein
MCVNTISQWNTCFWQSRTRFQLSKSQTAFAPLVTLQPPLAMAVSARSCPPSGASCQLACSEPSTKMHMHPCIPPLASTPHQTPQQQAQGGESMQVACRHPYCAVARHQQRPLPAAGICTTHPPPLPAKDLLILRRARSTIAQAASLTTPAPPTMSSCRTHTCYRPDTPPPCFQSKT